jgi:hypothetical protein
MGKGYVTFSGRPGPCLRWGSKDDSRESIWCAGLSCLFRSLNKTNQRNQINQIDEIDQKDQLNQIPATRREMGPGTCIFPP